MFEDYHAGSGPENSESQRIRECQETPEGIQMNCEIVYPGCKSSSAHGGDPRIEHGVH
jgi:hypothetical protein